MSSPSHLSHQSPSHHSFLQHNSHFNLNSHHHQHHHYQLNHHHHHHHNHNHNHHHQLWPPPSPPPSILARRQITSQLLARPLAPLFTLAAYSGLAFAALSALIGLLLTGYGLTAWDDAKQKLGGVRGLVGKRLDAAKDSAGGGVSPPHTPLRGERASGAARAAPHQSYQGREPSSPPSPRDSHPQGYEVSSDDEPPAQAGPQWKPPHTATAPRGLPPRPPLSVLLASLLLTLVVVTGRLMVVWWMGQQGQKNRTQAFRNGRRAFEAAQADHPGPAWSRTPSPSPKHRRRNRWAD